MREMAVPLRNGDPRAVKGAPSAAGDHGPDLPPQVAGDEAQFDRAPQYWRRVEVGGASHESVVAGAVPYVDSAKATPGHSSRLE